MRKEKSIDGELISQYHKERLEMISAELHISIKTLIGCALDKHLGPLENQINSFSVARMKVLSRHGQFCEDCGLPSNIIHHKDKNHGNQDEGNLKVVCPKCHAAHHRGDAKRYIKPSESKYRRQYGLSIKEMREILCLSHSRIMQLHGQGKLALLLKTIQSRRQAVDKRIAS